MKQSDYIHELIEQGRFTEAKLLLSAGTVRPEAIFELAFNLGNGFYSCEQFRDARAVSYTHLTLPTKRIV